jgi:hypothetical protein
MKIPARPCVVLPLALLPSASHDANHLESTRTKSSVTVDSTRLTETLSPLDATFTEILGEGGRYGSGVAQTSVCAESTQVQTRRIDFSVDAGLQPGPFSRAPRVSALCRARELYLILGPFLGAITSVRSKSSCVSRRRMSLVRVPSISTSLARVRAL